MTQRQALERRGHLGEVGPKTGPVSPPRRTFRRAGPLVLALLVSLLVPAVASAYDRDAAVKHAEAHWNDKSDSQPGGYIEGSDCTNYASGCFFDGGPTVDDSGRVQ